MLYGKLIFIKKTGGDGSRFPVTDNVVNIGRSDKCVIRVHNPLVSPEHCQLTVDKCGQATIRNISSTNPTLVNGEPVGKSDVPLHHGDIIKIGNRNARWEYLPSSKYFQSGNDKVKKLVIIRPQRTSEGLSAVDASKTKSLALVRRSYPRIASVAHFSAGRVSRHSLYTGKAIPATVSRRSLAFKKLPCSPQIKLRKSIDLESLNKLNLGSSTNTPVRRSQIWEVKSVSPPEARRGSIRSAASTGKSTPGKISKLETAEKVKSTARSKSKAPNMIPIHELSSLSVEKASDDVKSVMTTTTNSPSKLTKSPTPRKVQLFSPKTHQPMSSAKKKILFDPEALENATSFVAKSKPGRRSRPGTPFVKSAKMRASRSEREFEDSVSTPSLAGSKAASVASSMTDGSRFPIVMLSRIDSPNEILSSRKRKFSSSAKTPTITPSEKRKSSLLRRSKYIPLEVPSPFRSKIDESLAAKSACPDETRSRVGVESGSRAGTGSDKRGEIKTSTKSGLKAKLSRKSNRALVQNKAIRKLRTLQVTSISMRQKIVKKAIQQFAKSQKKKCVPVTDLRELRSTEKDKRKRRSTFKGGPSGDGTVTGDQFSEEAVNRSRTDLSGSDADDEYSTSKSCETDSGVMKSPASGETSGVVSQKAIEGNELVELPTEAVSSTSRPESELLKDAKGWKRSYSLFTPKISRDATAVRSASTSKINRKGSRLYYSKAGNSFISDANTTAETDFNFDEIRTPDVDVDMFVSPLRDDAKTPVGRRCVDFLTGASPRVEEASSNTLSVPRVLPRLKIDKCNDEEQQGSSMPVMDAEEPAEDGSKTGCTPDTEVTKKIMGTSKLQKSPNNDLTDVRGVKNLMATPKPQKSPNNDLTDVRGVKRFLATPEEQKSPKNDLTDVRGVKRLLATPKIQKSPKNDLTDVRGVKKLMATPRPQKSPKNDLTDIRGVKRLLATPKEQKSPKNDLTDVRGVKKLLATPKPQKSPKNDLTDVRGVKRLLATPKVQKSPKNDLTDVRGVKKLLATPKPQRSPKNDLTDVRGVKRLLATPKVQKSPKNDLTDVRGVKKLMATPKHQKSPKNDLTDVRGVKRLLATPKAQKSPKNDLTDVRGVKKLMATPKHQKSPKNDLTDVTGVKILLATPKEDESPMNDLTDVGGMERMRETITPHKSPKNDLTNVDDVHQLMSSCGDESPVQRHSEDVAEVRQLLIAGSSESELEGEVAPHKIKGVRTLYEPVSKAPKKEDSDPTGLNHLLSMGKGRGSLDISYTGIAELFMSPEKTTGYKSRRREDTSQETTEEEDESATQGTPMGAGKRKLKARIILQPGEAGEPIRRSTRKTARAVESEVVSLRVTRAKSRLRAKEETEPKSQQDDEIEESGTSHRTRGRPAVLLKEDTPRRQTRKKRVAEMEESPTVKKRTKKTADKVEATVPSKVASATKTRKAAVVEGDPSPIKTRGRSDARNSKPITTRSKTVESLQTKRTREKTKVVKQVSTSPAVTRQRKMKEGESPAVSVKTLRSNTKKMKVVN